MSEDLYVNPLTCVITKSDGTIVRTFGTRYDLERWLFKRGLIFETKLTVRKMVDNSKTGESPAKN